MIFSFKFIHVTT